MGQAAPFLSIVMPVRNEAGHIGDSLASVLAQDYPRDRMEILVVDGMSEDGTREMVRAAIASDSRVRLIDNPEGIVPIALNRGIQAAQGDIIVRMDGHTTFASDFLKQNVALLNEHPEAWTVGGPIVHRGRSTFGRAVAAAMSHPLGVGNASHRFERYEGYAEGAAFPAIRRWVFDRVGLFDEDLVRNQDDEFNFRVTEAGGKIFITPRVKYSYFVREQPGQLARQYFQYAFWRIPVMQKHGKPTTLRQTLPVLFFTMTIVLATAGLLLEMPWLAISLPACYMLGLVVAGAGLTRRLGLSVAMRVPLAMAIIHGSYAAGMAYGIAARLVGVPAWKRKGRMSTISR